MAKKYGIQIKGLGRALRPSGLGVLRPKPTGKGGKPLKPKPVGKKDGGMLKSVKPSQKGLSKLPKDVRNKMGYMKDGGTARSNNAKKSRGAGAMIKGTTFRGVY